MAKFTFYLIQDLYQAKYIKLQTLFQMQIVLKYVVVICLHFLTLIVKQIYFDVIQLFFPNKNQLNQKKKSSLLCSSHNQRRILFFWNTGSEWLCMHLNGRLLHVFTYIRSSENVFYSFYALFYYFVSLQALVMACSSVLNKNFGAFVLQHLSIPSVSMHYRLDQNRRKREREKAALFDDHYI